MLKKGQNCTYFARFRSIFERPSNMTTVIDGSVKCYKKEALENPKTVVKQEEHKIIFTEGLLNTNFLVKI